MSANLAVILMLAPLGVCSVMAFAADAFDHRRVALSVSILGLSVTAVAGFYSGVTVSVADIAGVLRTGGHFSALTGVIAACGALVLLGGWSILVTRPGGGTTAGLISLGAAAAAVMAAATDLTTLLLALEISAVISYALVSETKTTRSDEAAMKYFIQGSVATGFFVMGMAVLVGIFAPSGRFSQLAVAIKGSMLGGPVIVGISLIAAALAFKAGIAPFHTWAPDAYETTTPHNAAFLAAGPKLGAIAALVLFASVVEGAQQTKTLIPLLIGLSIISVAVGSIGALGQKSYRRMLAYAGIAQAGYALLAVAMLDATSTAFFLATYALASVGVFIAADSFQRANPEWDGSITGLAGMGRRAPSVSASVAVLLVSLAGIPPLLGFWGKFQVFATAIYGSAAALLGAGSREPLLGWLLAIGVAVGLLGSVISLGYYGSVLRVLYMTPAPPSDAATEAGQGRLESAWVLVAIAVAVVALGIAPAIWGYSVLVIPFVDR